MEKEIYNDAYFGVFYENHEDSTYIKANRNGIKAFINELNKKLNDFDSHLSKKDHYSIIDFKKGVWYDKNSHINLDWIEPINKTRNNILNELETETYESKWYQNIVLWLFAILLFGSLIVGFIQIIIWILKLIFS